MLVLIIFTPHSIMLKLGANTIKKKVTICIILNLIKNYRLQEHIHMARTKKNESLVCHYFEIKNQERIPANKSHFKHYIIKEKKNIRRIEETARY